MKLHNLSLPQAALFLEALLLLYLAKLMLLALPFRICARTIGSGKESRDPEKEWLKDLKQALSRANRFALWKNVCLVQSFAGRWMLQRRGIASSFMIGVAHDELKKLKAHAWLTAGEVEIVPKGGDYLVIKRY